MTSRATWPMLLAVVAVSACDSRAKPVASSPDSSQPIVAAPLASDTTCPPTGAWALCSAFRSIARTGLAVHKDSAKEVREPPLSVTGTELPISRGDVRFFLYADSMSRLRDEARLDRTQFILPVQQPGFKRERTIVHSANLLALINVLNDRNRERIANALMAGPPQPPIIKP